MHHTPPMPERAAFLRDALTTPRPIVDSPGMALEDMTRLLVEADAVRRELDAVRRLVWLLAAAEGPAVALYIHDSELESAPETARLSAHRERGGWVIEARS